MAAKGYQPELTAGRRAETRALKLVTMKHRADFLRAKTGRRYNGAALALEACLSPGNVAKEPVARVGFTATRQLCGAVMRNRAKRRLRAAARSVLTVAGRTGHDYVLIGRAATLRQPFSVLENDLAVAIAAVHAALDRGKRNAQPPR